MNAPQTLELAEFSWPEAGLTRVPYRLFSDPAVHEMEQQRIFRGPTWSYAGLEAELPNAGDYITTFIGDTPVIISRDQNDQVHGMVNRCAHRGAMVCRDLKGNTDVHTCVYHQWAFDLSGELIGVPFRRGLGGKGGYPADFDMADHGLQKLRVSTLHGLIYVTFDFDMVPLEEYLGEVMVRNLARCLEGREIEVLGYTRQFVNANWKLYGENTRDSYHAMLLHLFYPTFGIATPATKAAIEMNEERYHNLFTVWRPGSDNGMDTYNKNTTREFKGGKEALEAPEFLRFINERDDDIAITIESLFPNSVFQHIQNGFAVRQIRPKKIDEFELHWTYIGYKDDSDEMREHRMRQANLLGPAGLIAMEDAEAGEIIQRGIARDADQNSFVEMGGDGYGDMDSTGTDENSIRGFWKGYRELMGF